MRRPRKPRKPTPAAASQPTVDVVEVDGQLRVVISIPGLRVRNEMNGSREHWSVRSRRHTEQKFLTKHALNRVPCVNATKLRSAEKVVVRLTRIGGKQMDDDGLVSSFKWVRDSIAEWIGKSDAPGSGVVWPMPPLWEKGKEFAVKVEFEIL